MKPFVLIVLLAAAAWSQDAVDKAKSHFQTGLAYERLGRFDEAYSELQVANALDAKNAQMALALGVVANRLGRYDEALRALERSVALDANSVASYYELALLYEMKNEHERALESWHRFVSLSHDDALKAVARKHIAHLESIAP